MRYIIAKGYYGLGGSLAVLASSMRLADKYNATLVVDWLDGVYGLKGKDIFNEVFELPISNAHFRNVEGLRVWPAEWQGYYHKTMPHKIVNGLQLSRVTSEMVENSGELDKDNYDCFVVSRDDVYWHRPEFKEEISRYVRTLKPVARIRKNIDSYELGRACIGVHFRHGNGEKTVVPPNINWFFEKVNGFLDKSPSSYILVCTDCIEVLRAFEKKYPGKIVSSNKNYPDLGSGSMHLDNNNSERLQAIEEAIVDIWLMSKCSYIVGSKSFFSGVALKLSDGIEKENVKVWSPVWRSHKPASDEFPLEKHKQLSSAFESWQLLTDGIYLSEKNNVLKIRYLYHELGSYSSINEIDFQWLKKKLIKFRCY